MLQNSFFVNSLSSSKNFGQLIGKQMEEFDHIETPSERSIFANIDI